MDISTYIKENGEKFWEQPQREDREENEELPDINFEVENNKKNPYVKLIDMDNYNSTLEDNLYQEIDKKIKFY